MEQVKIRLLICDDHTIVRKGLKALLSAKKHDIEVIGEACNGNEAIQKAVQLEPDVILMDLVMPEKSGLEAISEIKKVQPQARILVLTSFADDENVIKAIREGAYGFLLKETSPDDLIQTIHSVHADKLTIPQELTQILLRGAGLQQASIPSVGELTPRELDVLRCIAQGMSNKQIARNLSISNATVRSHVTRMMAKLDMQNRTKLAIYAKDHNLI